MIVFKIKAWVSKPFLVYSQYKNNVMTEEIFKELGFECVEVSAEEVEDGRGFYYYSIDIGDICLMSNSDDEAEKEGW